MSNVLGPGSAEFAQKTLSYCDMVCKRKIDGRQDIDFFGFYVDHLLTNLPSIHYYNFSFWACRNSFNHVITKANQRGFGYGECE
jgi:hypothetical protein